MWDAGLENVRTWAGRGGPRDNVELGTCGLEYVWTPKRFELWDVWPQVWDSETCGLFGRHFGYSQRPRITGPSPFSKPAVAVECLAGEHIKHRGKEDVSKGYYDQISTPLYFGCIT